MVVKHLPITGPWFLSWAVRTSKFKIFFNHGEGFFSEIDVEILHSGLWWNLEIDNFLQLWWRILLRNSYLNLSFWAMSELQSSKSSSTMVKDSFQKLMLKSFILGYIRTSKFVIFFNHGEGFPSEIDAKILQELTTVKSFSFMFLFRLKECFSLLFFNF